MTSIGLLADRRRKLRSSLVSNICRSTSDEYRTSFFVSELKFPGKCTFNDVLVHKCALVLFISYSYTCTDGLGPENKI